MNPVVKYGRFFHYHEFILDTGQWTVPLHELFHFVQELHVLLLVAGTYKFNCLRDHWKEQDRRPCAYSRWQELPLWSTASGANRHPRADSQRQEHADSRLPACAFNFHLSTSHDWRQGRSLCDNEESDSSSRPIKIFIICDSCLPAQGVVAPAVMLLCGHCCCWRATLQQRWPRWACPAPATWTIGTESKQLPWWPGCLW